MDPKLTSTTFDIHGYRIVRQLGVVARRHGSFARLDRPVRARPEDHWRREIHEYVALCEETRGEAFDLMMGHAETLGANAIVGIRYDATELADNMTEVLAYGTAVVVEAVL